MISSVKFIVALAFAIQLTISSAFTTHGASRVTRSFSSPIVAPTPLTTLTHSTSIPSIPSTALPPLQMATATPTAPSKKSQKKERTTSDTPKDDEDKEPGWLVRLYNDPMNKREFVARCLVEICGLDDGMAFSVMMLAHMSGLAVIGKYHREMAEMYKNRLQSEGLTIDMVPAEEEE